MPREKLFVSPKDMPEEVQVEKTYGKYRLANHLVPFIVYIPVVILSIFFALWYCEIPFVKFIVYFVVAIPLWTGFEYFAHKYVLHAHPKSEFWKKVLYGVHTGHHDYPNDNRFILVGLDVSIAALVIFYGVSFLFLGVNAFSFMAGWVATYIFYDWLHYAVHNFNFKNKLFKIYQKHHLDHHFIDNEKNFGFISLLWDEMFNTKIGKEKKKSEVETML